MVVNSDPVATQSGIQSAINAKEARALRWATPLLLAAICVLGWRMYDTLIAKVDKIDDGQADQKAQIAEVKSDVRDINTRLTISVVKDVDDLKSRVKQLENATKTP